MRKLALTIAILGLLSTLISGDRHQAKSNPSPRGLLASAPAPVSAGAGITAAMGLVGAPIDSVFALRGGGTTDFTLIRVYRAAGGQNTEDGQLQLHRVSVGDHLILGGDNLDLALAQLKESASSDPLLRLLKVPHKATGVALESFDAKWSACDPGSAATFSGATSGTRLCQRSTLTCGIAAIFLETSARRRGLSTNGSPPLTITSQIPECAPT